MKIDFDNIDQRILALPMPPRRYMSLQVGKAGVLYALEAPAFAPGVEFSLTVHRHDLKSRKSDVPSEVCAASRSRTTAKRCCIDRASAGSLPRPGPWRRLRGPLRHGATHASGGPTTGALERTSSKYGSIRAPNGSRCTARRGASSATSSTTPTITGWTCRRQRSSTQPYLESLGARRDLNYLFQEMLGELTVGHLFAGGGDYAEVKRVQTGLLGADYKLENGRYRLRAGL